MGWAEGSRSPHVKGNYEGEKRPAQHMPNGRYTLKRLSSLQHRHGANVDCDVLYGDAQWRHLMNPTEPFMCSGDTASCHVKVVLVVALLLRPL